MVKLPIGLNSSTIQDFIDGIKKVRNDLQDREKIQEEEINKLLDEAYDYAITILADLAIYDDTDMTAVINKLSIRYYDSSTHRGELFLAGGEKEENVALYVEFGTGIVGSQEQHPAVGNGETKWGYDLKGHGESGWWYPAKEGNWRNRYTFRGENGNLLAWTKGMPSRPFMYDTMLWLKDQIGEKYKVGFEFKGGTK
jgi:hypothetical protein